MNRLLILPVLLLTLLVGTPASSADFQKGLNAAKSGDFATALREWTPLAEQGDAVAQTLVGSMYNEGKGVPQDYKTAVKWYKLAAEQGDALAQNNLGAMYALGHGVIQDWVYAHMWGNIGASNGSERGAKVRDLAAKNMTPSQLETAKKLARECIRKKYKGCESAGHQKGLTAAQSADFQKGLTAYHSGDYASAMREWTPLAEQGDASAQTLIGAMYNEGKGVPQDYKTSVKWFKLAAEQGDADAQGNLGMMYAFGWGVLKDYVYAHMWGNIAAKNGNELGAKLRDDFEKKMTPSQLETAQKLARECVRKKYKGC